MQVISSRHLNSKQELQGYYSKIMNSSKVSFFYGEGLFDEDVVGLGNEDSFINEIVTGINKKNIGGEFGMEYQITSTIKVTGAASYAEYKYDNNPNLKINDDAQASLTNTSPITDFGPSYLKGYHVSGMPQQAYSIGFGIQRSLNSGGLGANANYLADTYIDISNVTRTTNFVIADPTTGIGFDGATEDAVRNALRQEKFDPVTLVNLVGGKSWKVGNDTFGFFASVNNVFDVTYKTGGFEQSRKATFPDYVADNANGTPSFGHKYFYGFGRTYFVNVYINF